MYLRVSSSLFRNFFTFLFPQILLIFFVRSYSKEFDSPTQALEALRTIVEKLRSSKVDLIQAKYIVDYII